MTDEIYGDGSVGDGEEPVGVWRAVAYERDVRSPFEETLPKAFPVQPPPHIGIATRLEREQHPGRRQLRAAVDGD